MGATRRPLPAARSFGAALSHGAPTPTSTPSRRPAPLQGIELIVVACNGAADAPHRACRSVRAVATTRLALMTSSRREADELLAFDRDCDCDDYITTSSSPEVIRVRLEVLAARVAATSASSS